MVVIEKAETVDYLGQEFLTWLGWQSEANNGRIRQEGIEPFELWFESPVQLMADYGESTVVGLRGPTPVESPEARQALREGKKIDRSRLRVVYRNQTYTFGFHASKFGISGMKLPIPPNTSPADFLHVRLELLEEFEKFFLSVFERFLALRLSAKSWSEERKRMSRWIGKHES